MLVRLKGRGICQSCRLDLQTLFERGFCTTTPQAKSRHARVRRHQYRNTNARTFSQKPYSFAQLPHNEFSSSADGYEQDFGGDEAVLSPQATLLAQFEKELGKPLEQVTEEDQIPAELVEKYRDVLSMIQPADQTPATIKDTVTHLRHTGADSAAVVREARQVHGDVLPDGTLNEQELLLYRRFYGEPSKQIEKEELFDKNSGESDSGQNQLFSAEGERIEVRGLQDGNGPSQQENKLSVSTQQSTEIDSVRAMDVARSVGGSLVEEDEHDDFEDEEDASESERGHPLTDIGKFRTNPKTVFLPQEGFAKPVEKIMSNFSNKHLKEMCERTFGGPGLPDSPLTPRSARTRKQIPVPLDASQNTMGEMEANAFVSAVMPPTYASIMSVLVETRKRLGATWLTNLVTRQGGPRVLDAGSGGAGIIAWREVVQAHWDSLHTSSRGKSTPPPSKSVVLTGSDGLRHRAADLLENTTFIPRLPDYVHTRDAPTLEDDRPGQQRKQFDIIIASHTLFAHREEWMRKQHVQNLWSMLSDKGGVLILVEKGIPRGFEAVAAAREFLLDRYIAIPEGQTTHYSPSHAQQLGDGDMYRKEAGMIVAPCTNHERCPMYSIPGLSRGRKDICSFQQRYIRPPFLQRVLGAKDRNHDDVDFSYISILKGDDLRQRDMSTWTAVSDPIMAPRHPNPIELNQEKLMLLDYAKSGFEEYSPETDADENLMQSPTSSEQLPTFQQMPRIVYPPLKRTGHVSIDLCTPTGQIERWTIPRSFSKQAYRDARKSKWGDLWALGAKTHTARNLKLGTPEKDLVGKEGEILSGKGRGRKERLKIKAMQLLEQQEEQRMDDLMEQRDMIASLDAEFEEDIGVPRDTESTKEAATNAKPMNNRERKAARRALREAQNASRTAQQANGAADLSFKPRAFKRPTEDPMDDIASDHAMADWQAEFERAAKTDKGTKKWAFDKFGSSSKSAKSLRSRNSARNI